MSYLIAKIFFLLLLSALGGALLMYWWVRRRYKDITVSYVEAQAGHKATVEQLDKLHAAHITLINEHGQYRAADKNWRADINKHLKMLSAHVAPMSEAIQKVNISDSLPKIFHGLDTIQNKVDSLSVPRETDLAPVLSAIKNIHIPQAKEADLSPVLSAINSIHIPEAKETDLSPVLEAVHGIHIPEAKETDLSPVLDAVHGIHIPQAKEADLSPVLSAINNIHIPEAKEANLSPILDAIKQFEKPQKVEQIFVEQRVEGSNTNRLQKAAFGKPDDLKNIKGVGPKLEKMLHGIGVYYFWQVAEWQSNDIAEVDALLDAFTGRIERDNWVVQAATLAKAPNAVAKP